jgi:antitoxin YobK
MATPDRYDRLAEVIAKSERANFGHGVPEQVIADAERHLGVAFPPSYRWWLEKYGAGYIGGYELQGLVPEMIANREPDLPLIGDLVYLADLRAKRPGHPMHLLEILSYEGDEVYLLDTARRGPDGECPVVCRHAGSDELQDVAADFAGFLERELAA